jgi:hypothetical protein
MFSPSVVQQFISTRDLPSETAPLNGGKLYSITNEKFSAIVIVLEIGNGAQSMQIASVYGQFDHNILGNSFNLPPSEATNGATPETDMSIPQMCVYKNDQAGASFFNLPSAPPKCDVFNYALMTMDVRDGKFSLKPKGWKTGTPFYELDVSTLTPLPLTHLSSPNLWCKPKSEKAKVKSVDSPQGNIGSIIIFFIVFFALLSILFSLSAKYLFTDDY